MKWLTLAGVLVYLARHSDAGALKCTHKSQEPSFASEKRDILPVQSLVEQEKETESDDTECLAGSEWESNCHKCRCSDSGIAECLKQDSCDVRVFGEPVKCKPYTSFKRGCNICRCVENGLGLCTLTGCLPVERRKKQLACTPGSTWKSWNQNDCAPSSKDWKNSCDSCSCHCISDGQKVCSEVKCSESLQLEKRDVSKLTSKDIKKHAIAKRGVCKPNQEFQVECNPCICAANGQSYTCTHNECLEGLEGKNMNKEVEVFMESEGSDHIERHSVCKPRDTFYVGCNTCHCNPYGTDYSCTNKPCPLPVDVEVFHELKVKLRVVMEKCRPHEVFEMDCNMCRCNADGTSFSCTRRACVEVDDKNSTLTRQTRAAQEPLKTCQPGTEFRMDCNKCLCNDEGQDFSCTRIDCAAANNNGGVDSFVDTRSKRELSEVKPTECVPGSVFDRDCNVCRCTEDGLHATCTLKRCKQPTTEANTEPTPSFRCTPGDQFKRDCNDCTCSADGKNVFCTLRLCDQELADM